MIKYYFVDGLTTAQHFSNGDSSFIPQSLSMDLCRFENLDINAKACFVWKHGVLIGYGAKGKCYTVLYRLKNFYVELQYHTCYDGIANVKSFVCDEELQPYLEQIDLSQLLAL